MGGRQASEGPLGTKAAAVGTSSGGAGMSSSNRIISVGRVPLLSFIHFISTICIKLNDSSLEAVYTGEPIQ